LALLRRSAAEAGDNGANLNACEKLYGQAGAVTSPHLAYITERSGKVVVATDERDLAQRDEIHARARASGIQGSRFSPRMIFGRSGLP
jgi:hypothetical protein